MHAVTYGGLLCTFLNYADRVKIANQSLLVNEGGMITTDPKGKAIRQATFYPFQDAAKYAKGTALRASAKLPEKETEHHGMQETVTVACTYDETTGQIAVFAMNCDAQEDVTLSLSLRSFGTLRSLGWRELYNEDMYARNTFEEEFRVVPADRELPEIQDSQITVTLKKHSWNVLRFEEAR